MNLNRQLLEQQERVYAKMEGRYDEELQRLETLPEAFEQGTWSWDDLEWIVQWKMTGLPFVNKVLDDFKTNKKAFTNSQITRAVDAPRPEKKLAHLIELNGVAERMGTAFLLFMNPEQYTVLDWKAWSVLYNNGYLHYQMPDKPSIGDYQLYLGACWTLANEYNVSLRTLDMALWTLGGKE